MKPLSPGDVGRLAFWALFVLLLSYLPLRGADLWEHVSYGGWVLDHGTLPTEDPFLPLAAGMEVVNGAWLSQVLLAAVDRWVGLEGLSALFVLVVGLTYWLLARAFRWVSGDGVEGILGVLAVLGMGWSRATSLRPGTLGMLAFAVLIWLLARDDDRPAAGRGLLGRARRWVGVPLVLALWANLDASFLAGLAFLWCRAVGAAIDAVVCERSLRAPLADAGVRERFWLAELGLLATLMNPYGLDLLLRGLGLAGPESFAVPAPPLTLAGPGGIEIALALAALLFVVRRSRRRLPAADLLLLAVFGVAAALRVDLIGWLAPVLVWVLVPHVSELVPKWVARRRGSDTEGPIRSWRWTLIGVMTVWIAFALSPWSTSVLGGTARTQEQWLDRTSPPEVADYLWSEAPSGQLFHPAEWGDWLAREGKPGLRPFVGRDPRRVPRRVWTDYLAVTGARADWQRLLERYRVEMVVVDREEQAALARALRASPDWRQAHHDPRTLIFVPTAMAPEGTS